ncbi:2-oxoglutarate ferredoxin oxidoreductase subunit alpha [Thermanaeromonas toyohensis ToBE]|uniref:2-oxoglutarate ferredoxin oxidoreductase subunit alpha n=1 Tax=Thermanaeromonas toyohensis ToBE TaxID=698762 RepID=A0A1W1V6T8_9FIRM|nr:3-methyl-2-oxobutanoate dehydrogenase subunit VorB [Thermanaeromonas toyohensis]SMB88704.1 2-oxoglutarate ferredoxin oxidoreductase subunit alpha [Thermanaeromonas toyohensis ToBE]
MTEMVLMKGNEAVAEAAILAGCRYYFGYPITPQNEISEYMAKRMPEVGGVFLQAESELAAINMVYGAAGAGGRVMTSSSSPGISLMQEGLSYLAAAELPCVVINMMRGGPGLGGIQPSQADYFQAVKGGGHGDYHLVVLAPATIQEMIDLTIEAFDIADNYRVPVMVLGDGMLGQMMEAVNLRLPRKIPATSKSWATTGAKGRARNIITTLYLDPAELEKHNLRLQEKYVWLKEREVRYEELNCEDAEIIIVAYGTTSRIARTAIKNARAEGIRVGLLRPITLWPFPAKAFKEILERGAKAFLCIEMSAGQMVEDVRLAVDGKAPVYFYGRTGGVVPNPREVLEEIKKVSQGER